MENALGLFVEFSRYLSGNEDRIRYLSDSGNHIIDVNGNTLATLSKTHTGVYEMIVKQDKLKLGENNKLVWESGVYNVQPNEVPTYLMSMFIQDHAAIKAKWWTVEDDENINALWITMSQGRKLGDVLVALNSTHYGTLSNACGVVYHLYRVPDEYANEALSIAEKHMTIWH